MENPWFSIRNGPGDPVGDWPGAENDQKRGQTLRAPPRQSQISNLQSEIQKATSEQQFSQLRSDRQMLVSHSMKFKNAELQEYYDHCYRQAVSSKDSDLCAIQCLMDCLDRFKAEEFHDFFPAVLPTWQPHSDKFREIISCMIAPEQRCALQKWFAPNLELNPSAKALKDALYSMIGEGPKPANNRPKPLQ